jgi:hypothetical protein
MYEGFSGQARQAVALACEEARRRGHDYVGTEHVLLGVLREGSASVAALLAAAGVEVEAVYRAVEPLLPPAQGAADWEQLPLTPAAKRALEAARQEAATLQHASIGPEDMLLGLLRDPEGSAAQALLALGLSADALRAQAAKLPASENRDWLLRPEPTPGGPARGDPSADELAARVSQEVLPPVRAGQPGRAIRLPPGRLRRQSVRTEALLTDASLDLPVVEKQLRALQLLLATVAGAAVGARLLGLPGCVVGAVVGLGVAATRYNLACALAGMSAGAVYGLHPYPGDLLLGFLWAFAGLALGACLGDWRRLPAPPGSGQGPPTDDDPEKDAE